MRHITPNLVLDVISERSGIARDALLQRVRNASIVPARQAAVYLCYRMTNLSFAAIGRHMGLEIATVLYARGSVRERMASTPAYAAFVQESRAEIVRRAWVARRNA
jgi:chromosomal replication initiator protein